MIDRQKIPNYLTYARVVGILPVCLLLTSDHAFSVWSAFVLYALLAVTDWLDGYLARKWNVKSEIGRFLDPIADKLLIAAVLIMLVANGSISGLMLICPIVILIREIFISGLREFLGPRNVIVHVTFLAKVKTATQLVACALLILQPVGLLMYVIGNGVLVCATILTAASGWQYWQQTAKYLKDAA